MRRWVLLILCFSLLCMPVKAQSGGGYVALTFDDGPSGRFTKELLEGLRERNVKATFLLCGYRICQYPQLTGQIYEDGHEIGIHGYSHGSMAKMTAGQIARELEQTAALLPQGCTPVFLRPPGGATTQTVKKAAKEAKLGILTWSVDPKDWAVHDALAVEQAVVSQVRDGDVILLHDMSRGSVQAALAIVDILRDKGFQFVTASQLAAMRLESVKPGQIYTRFA